VTLDDIHRLFASLTDLDTALRIHDCSNETLLAVAERLEQSALPRHYILREAELDDLWRYVEATVERARNNGADANVMRGLERLLSIIMEAHDLAGDGATSEAAQKPAQCHGLVAP
jgi:hypothetical protein